MSNQEGSNPGRPEEAQASRFSIVVNKIKNLGRTRTAPIKKEESTGIMGLKMDRRTFLRGSAAVGGGLAADQILSHLPNSENNRANAQPLSPTAKPEEAKKPATSVSAEPQTISPTQNNLEAFQANGLVTSYETKPSQITREVSPGRIYWGQELPPELKAGMDEEKARLSALGIADHDYLGYEKGVYYLSQEGRLYPFITYERGVYHPVMVDGKVKLLRTLTVSDLAQGTVQLDYEGKVRFPLSENEKTIIAQTAITGEPGSNVPTIPKMVEKNLLTLTGNENYKPDRTGQAITERIDKSGNITNDQSSDYKYAAYMNGHNIPDVVIKFFNDKFGSINEAINVFGYPISDTYKVTSLVKGQPTELYVLATERGMLTITPSDPPEYVVQGGLLGNRFKESLDLPKGGGEIPRDGDKEYKSDVNSWYVLSTKDSVAQLEITDIQKIDREVTPLLAGKKMDLRLMTKLEAQERYGLNPNDTSIWYPIELPNPTGRAFDGGKQAGYNGELLIWVKSPDVLISPYAKKILFAYGASNIINPDPKNWDQVMLADKIAQIFADNSTLIVKQ
ncbi:MAG: twin-arginine translocation signal domain-containing protein [Patescibacteria group bacterium]|nr:twin-arginine translocation signal domain-containing protein [Patescibacteria group bacterium]